MLIIVKYGPENPAEQGKLALAAEGDEVVLLQNGIFWAISEKLAPVLAKGLKVYALESDLLARGYSPAAAKTPLITYDGLLDIVERQEKSLG